MRWTTLVLLALVSGCRGATRHPEPEPVAAPAKPPEPPAKAEAEPQEFPPRPRAIRVATIAVGAVMHARSRKNRKRLSFLGLPTGRKRKARLRWDGGLRFAF